MRSALRPNSALSNASDWTDVSGLLTPREELARLEVRVADGTVGSYDALIAELQAMYDRYKAYEWQYVYETYEKECGVALSGVTSEHLLAAVNEWEEVSTSIHGMILDDSKKEYGTFAQIGYGLDQPPDNVQRDFEAVRGTIETNSVVQKLAAEGAAIRQKKEQFNALIASIPA